MWKAIERCRLCGASDFEEAFSLGMQVVKDFVDSANDGSKKGPLDLVLCKTCGFLQLRHTFSKDYLYTHYWYRSGTSPTMIFELADIVKKASTMVNLEHEDFVIDIGANDGTLLKQYENKNLTKVGFEPSNLWKYGVSPGTTIINDYFNARAFMERFPGRKAKIITSIAMFYDLDDPNGFVKDIRSILHPDGVWIVQMNYLGLMLKNLGYDNVCHEHVGYYGLTTMEYLLSKHDMEVFDVELNNVNGGSFRLYIKHSSDKSKKINTGGINQIRAAEDRMGISKSHTYVEFSKQIEKQREELNSLLSELSGNGKNILIYGASTRGLVILEYCGIDSNIIKYATDKNSDKWGKYLSGTGIKIISLEEYRKMKPDYLLVPPYQYALEIANQERDFIDGGGKLIIPLPTPKILNKDDLSFGNPTEFLQGYDKL
jgi:hypothetical protein